MRRYILNRASKLNALTLPMIQLLQPQVEEWEQSDLCKMIVGTGDGRAFCAGGDVRYVVESIQKEESRRQGPEYFKAEFELDFLLATLKKPYIAICDGITMGGGVGLTAHAPIRVATERTTFAMPETNIGYAPDVGASYFLSRLDGAVGTYLALTANSLQGREVFENRLATHYVPSGRIPELLSALSSLSPEHSDLGVINRTIEEFYDAEDTSQPQRMTSDIRKAIDHTFSAKTVPDIIKRVAGLQDQSGPVGDWAKECLGILEKRSPTSLFVALECVRRGKTMTLAEVLNMEYKMASAYCNGASPDFITGVTAVLISKEKGRPVWQPSTADELSYKKVILDFFEPSSKFLEGIPALELRRTDDAASNDHMKYALPSEELISKHVTGRAEDSGATGINEKELIAIMEEIFPGKGGLQERVKDIVARKCKVVDPEGYQTLSWIF